MEGDELELATSLHWHIKRVEVLESRIAELERVNGELLGACKATREWYCYSSGFSVGIRERIEAAIKSAEKEE